jgi:ribosomal protein S17E
MGKIKIKLVKRTSGNLAKRDLPFNASFENNKRILGSNTMPGKKIRNQVAG